MPLHTRQLLERMFGFSRPVALADGSVGYACDYCALSGGPCECHDADCPYWTVAGRFDGPVARSLFERSGMGGVAPA